MTRTKRIAVDRESASTPRRLDASTPATRPERIAVYGKGGVGKSVVATNLSVCYAREKLRVLHIGCDPKHDSAVRLLGPDTPVRTVLDLLGERPSGLSGRDVINTGRLGIACCESGGPEPGVGCAGRGVARTLEFLEGVDLLTSGDYDVVLFDVLGDVVCGGFAAPLRAGFARKVVVVTSEEPMSLFAANNICKAVRTYADNGVVLGGLVANLRRRDADRTPIDVLAGLIGTRVLAALPWDERIVRAERNLRTLVEYAPRSDTARTIGKLARTILDLDADSLDPPNPLSDREFFRFAADATARD